MYSTQEFYLSLTGSSSQNADYYWRRDPTISGDELLKEGGLMLPAAPCSCAESIWPVRTTLEWGLTSTHQLLPHLKCSTSPGNWDSSDSQWAAGLIRSTALDAITACTVFPVVYSGCWFCLKGLAALSSILQQLRLATFSLQPLPSDISFEW